MIAANVRTFFVKVGNTFNQSFLTFASLGRLKRIKLKELKNKQNNKTLTNEDLPFSCKSNIASFHPRFLCRLFVKDFSRVDFLDDLKFKSTDHNKNMVIAHLILY